MRWITFAIVLYLVLVLQTAAAPYLALHSVTPDFLLIAAVYFALFARPADAMLACWIIGLAMDLTSLSYGGRANVGLCALSLGLIGLLIVKARDLFFRESVVSQIVLCFAAKLLLAAVVALYALWASDALSRYSEMLGRGFYEAIYAAVLAPYGHWILGRLRNPLGVPVHERWGVR